MNDDPSAFWHQFSPWQQWVLILAAIIGLVLLAMYGGTCQLRITTNPTPTTMVP